MDNSHLSDSLHEFFENGTTTGLSEKTPLKSDVVEKKEMNETQQTPVEKAIVCSRDENDSVETGEKEEHNDSSDVIDDEEDKDVVNESSKEGIVIVQIDNDGQRLPRRSNSEVVIPCTPEFTPESSLSGSTSCCSCETTASDYSDSDSEPLDDDPTPVVIIKKLKPSSNVSDATDTEADTDDVEHGIDNTSLASSVVEIRGSEDMENVDVSDDEANESDEDGSDVNEAESDTTTDSGDSDDDGGVGNGDDGNFDREMLYMHYRENGQSVVEKVYLDISKFIEENAGLLKELATPETVNGLSQSFSVTAEIQHLEETITEITQRPSSARCKMPTESKVSKNVSDKSDNRRPIDSPASQCDTEIPTVRSEDSNDVSRAVSTDNHGLKANITEGATNVQNEDLKTKHYKVLPAIGKGKPDGSSTQQTITNLYPSKPMPPKFAVPKTLNKSATVAPKQCTMRKPPIPRQLRSVACYQDGNVCVSIHGDQRLFTESEPPHLNITFVHRPEPAAKKQANPQEEVGSRDEKIQNNFVNHYRRDGLTDKRNANPTRVQAKSATRKPPLPSIINSHSANKKQQKSSNTRQQTAKKVIKSAANPKRANHVSAKQVLPPLKRVPKTRQPQSKNHIGKKTKSCSDNYSTQIRIPMPRQISGLNWNVVQTRAQWPPFNTHLNPEASERHHKMFTNIV